MVYTCSGSRGNIGLMCWAFALFDIGFILALCVRSILLWCSRLPLRKKQFATTLPWEFVIQTALIIALASTTSAIALLNVTIYLFTPPITVQDIIQWDIAPTPSAVLAMTVLAGAMLTVTICVFLSWWSNDFKSGPPKRTGTSLGDHFV